MESCFGNNILEKKNWLGLVKKKKLIQTIEYTIKKWVEGNTRSRLLSVSFVLIASIKSNNI